MKKRTKFSLTLILLILAIHFTMKIFFPSTVEYYVSERSDIADKEGLRYDEKIFEWMDVRGICFEMWEKNNNKLYVSSNITKKTYLGTSIGNKTCYMYNVSEELAKYKSAGNTPVWYKSDELKTDEYKVLLSWYIADDSAADASNEYIPIQCGDTPCRLYYKINVEVEEKG